MSRHPALTRFTDWLAGRAADRNAPSEPTQKDELRAAMEHLQRAADLGDDDRAMVAGLLNLRELEVSDAMVHRTKMATLDAGEPPWMLWTDIHYIFFFFEYVRLFINYSTVSI